MRDELLSNISNIVALLYLLTTLLFIAYLTLEKKVLYLAINFIIGISFLLHSVSITIHRFYTGYFPMTNISEYMSLFAWFSTLAYFILLKQIKDNKVIHLFIIPIIFMFYSTAALLPSGSSQSIAPALKSNWLKIHVSFAILGEVAFMISFAAAVLYLIKAKLSAESSLSKKIPELTQLEEIAYKSSKIGYPLFTVGALFAGAIWAEQAWGTFWSWDPKEVFSLIVWLIYTIYFHIKVTRNWSGTKTSIILIIGFLTTLLTIFSSMFMSGMHSYG